MATPRDIIEQCQDEELRAAVLEILEWQASCRLEGNALHSIAERVVEQSELHSMRADALQVSVSLVLREAATRWAKHTMIA